MPNVVVNQLDVAEHIVRSVRGWLHALYPEHPIYLTTKQAEAAAARPAFRLDLVAGPTPEPAAPGAFFVDVRVAIRYAAPDYWDAQRVVSRITTRCSHPAGRIPLSLYNVVWPSPVDAEAVADAGTLSAGTYSVAVAVEDADGNRSAPGDRVSVTALDGAAIDLVTSAWPGHGFVRTVLVYAALGDGPLRLQGSVDVPPGAAPTDAVEFTLDAYDDAGAAPVSNQRLPFSGLRVQSVDAAVVEQPGSEETFDGLVTLNLRCSVQRVLPLHS